MKRERDHKKRRQGRKLFRHCDSLDWEPGEWSHEDTRELMAFQRELSQSNFVQEVIDEMIVSGDIKFRPHSEQA